MSVHHSHTTLTSLLDIKYQYPAELRDELLRLEQQQMLRCTFHGFDPLVSADSLNIHEQDVLYPALQWVGAKGLRVLPHVLTYGRTGRLGTKPYLRTCVDPRFFALDGGVVLFCTGAVPLELLDELGFSQLLVIPHSFAFSPNGIWRLERGDKHALVQSASALKVWALSAQPPQPDVYLLQGVHDPFDFTGVRGLDVFTSLDTAMRCAAQLNEPGVPLLSPCALSGRDLLACLAQVDVVSVNDAVDVALTPAGAAVLGRTDVVSAADLFSALV